MRVPRAGARRNGLSATPVDDAALRVGVVGLAGGLLLYMLQNDPPDVVLTKS